MNEQLTQKDYELINSYLDQELDRKEVVKFAGRMAEDPLIASEVGELMQVKAMIKELPTVTPPRNYFLTRAMAEEARPKPLWERLFPVFRAAAAFCALALVFTFVFPYLSQSSSKSSQPAENYAAKGLEMESFYEDEEFESAAEEAAPMALYDEQIVLEDRDYGGAAESYSAVMPSFGVRGGNPRIEYMMRQEENKALQNVQPLDPDNPPEGFISTAAAEAGQRSLALKIVLGFGVVLSLCGSYLLRRKKQSLEVR